MRNQFQTWFSDGDEDAFSQRLRSQYPTLFFIDHDVAGTSAVMARTQLQDCPSGFAYVWDACTDNPEGAAERWQDCVRERSVGAVVQFLRSRLVEEDLVNGKSDMLLLSGRVAACFAGKGTPEQIELKRDVFKAVNAVSSADIVPVLPTTREIIGGKCPGVRVGRHAAQWCQSPDHLLRHVATKQLYCLPAIVAKTPNNHRLSPSGGSGRS